MPEFVDISQLTKKSSATGNEEFQVSATEKVTAQQIANLAPTSGDPQDAKISKYINTGSLVIPENLTNTQSILQALTSLAVLAGDNPGHRIKNFISYIDGISNPINVTIFEHAFVNSTAGVYFGPNKIGFGVFTDKTFDQTLTIINTDFEAYQHLKAQGFWTKEINVADLGGGGSTSNPLDAKMTGWTALTSGQGYNIEPTNSLMRAIKLVWGHISNGEARVISYQDALGLVSYSYEIDSMIGFILDTSTRTLYMIPVEEGAASTEFTENTDAELVEYIRNNGIEYPLSTLRDALTSQKSLYILEGSTGTVSWNKKYKVTSSTITIDLPSVSSDSHNASDIIEIWSPGITTINLGNPGGVLIYIRERDQTQPAITSHKKTTITNPLDNYYYVTVDYFKSK
jgi:hypothetical protein